MLNYRYPKKATSKMLNLLLSNSAPQLAIKLGSATAKAFTYPGSHPITSEPSYVAVYEDGPNIGQIAGVGSKAKELLGRTSEKIKSSAPLLGGSIRNFKHTKILLNYMIEQIEQYGLSSSPQALITYSSRSSDVERFALREAAGLCGIEQSYLIEEPLLSALGAGLPILDTSASMIIDIGAGLTTAAVIVLGGIAAVDSIPIAGNTFDQKIAELVRREQRAVIGMQTSEQIKKSIGRATTPGKERGMTIQARELGSGNPKNLTISESDIFKATRGTVCEIARLATSVLEMTTPEMASDIADSGIVVLGGGAFFRDIDVALEEEIGIPVVLAERPDECVTDGAKKMLQQWSRYQHLISAAE
jgi:rod shape-determining protein MreB